MVKTEEEVFEACGNDGVRCDGCASKHPDGHGTQNWERCPMGNNSGKGPLTHSEIIEKIKGCNVKPDKFCRNNVPCSVYRHCAQYYRKS